MSVVPRVNAIYSDLLTERFIQTTNEIVADVSFVIVKVDFFIM